MRLLSTSSLRLRLLLLVLLTVLPAVGLVLYNAQQDRDRERQLAQESALRGIRIAVNEQTRFIEALQQVLASLSRNDAVLASLDPTDAAGTGNPNDCSTSLAEQHLGFVRYESIGVAKPDGTVICSATPLPSTVNIADRPFFSQVVANGAFALGDYEVGTLSTRGVLPFAHAITGPDHTLLGVIYATLDVQMISTLAEQLRGPDGEGITVFDRQGMIIIKTPNVGDAIGRRLPEAIVQHVIDARGEGTVSAADIDGEDHLFAFAPLNNVLTEAPLYIMVGTPTNIAYARVNHILARNLLGLGLVAALTLAAAWLGSEYFFMRRLRSLMRTTQRLAGGELDARTGFAANGDELHRMAAAIDEMAVALQQRDALRTYEASHDALTGLANRAHLMRRLDAALTADRAPEQAVALLFLDLDGFKVINDSLGHNAGDTLLQVVAERLTATVPATALAARFGGDEFTVLVTDTPSAATLLAEHLIERIQQPITLAGREVSVSASAGIAFCHVKPCDSVDLLREADIALYRAKAQGKARVCVFDPDTNATALAQLEREAELRAALDQRQLSLHYQPVVDLASGQVRGVEALLRWQHPERGMIPPLEFIPLAEETGLIVPIGDWVLREACAQARRWRQTHGSAIGLTMSVNISARQFRQPDLAGRIAAILSANDLPASTLELEITESLLVEDVPDARGTLQALRDLGVRIAVDDFGTGYSALNYLRHFPLDRVKIDRDFVRDLGQDQGATAIVRAVVALGHALGMTVTAEGIETPEQLAHLRHLGCNDAQGFLLARPTAAGQVQLDRPRDLDNGGAFIDHAAVA